MKEDLSTLQEELEIVQSDINNLKSELAALRDKPKEQMYLYRPVTESDSSAIKSVMDCPITANLFGASGATAANYGIFFIADRACEVTSVKLRYTTASTSGILQIEKLNGTDALDSGDVVLTGTISLSATANTTYSGTLVSTIAKSLSAGDALALKDAGTLTNLVGLCVSVTVKYK